MKKTLDFRLAWSGLTRYGVMTVKIQFQSYSVSHSILSAREKDLPNMRRWIDPHLLIGLGWGIFRQ